LNSLEKEASLYTVIIIASHGRVVLQEPSVMDDNPYVPLCVSSTSLYFKVISPHPVGISVKLMRDKE
jgi:hypothetical protein